MESKRAPASLKRKHLDPRLLRYSGVAGAVLLGVSKVPASGSIVYSGVQNILLSDSNNMLEIDLDGDGFADFQFNFYESPGSGYVFRTLTLTGMPPSTSLWFQGFGSSLLRAFGSGESIGIGAGTTSYFTGTLFDAYVSYSVYPFGEFAYGLGEQFAGVLFEIDGFTHAGWIGVEVVDSDYAEARITGWAYNSIPGATLQGGAIPEPGTVAAGLGLLALGAVGIRRLRNRRRQAAECGEQGAES